MKTKLPIQGSLILASLLAFHANAGESLPMPTFHGNFDVSFGLELAEEVAFAFNDAPGDANYIGIEGTIPLETGHTLTYLHEANMNLVDGGGFGGSYQTYLGFKTADGEYRVGNLDLPLRRVMDKADLFSGTYADLNNVVIPNTTADSALMFLSQTNELTYALSVDFGQARSENANDKDAIKFMRMGAMADMSINDNFSLAVGFENSDASTDLGFTANFDLNDDVSLNASISRSDKDAAAPLTITVGGYTRFGDDARIKAQIGMQDPDTNADNAIMLAVGYDRKIASNLTAYGLIAVGPDGGLATTVEQDNDGGGNVIAVGMNLSF